MVVIDNIWDEKTKKETKYIVSQLAYSVYE